MPLSAQTKVVSRLLVAAGISILILGSLRLFLGPVYVLEDGCRCGRARRWYSFDQCPPLRRTKFFLKVISEGDPKHQHLYWDATWSEHFWLFPSKAFDQPK
jgi:hypothetical protein